ncbi:type I restriction-modification system [Candidatus Colimorpha enterica]|uniref:site-specific DNA-methyltransferase (adenine-specific) n=1 Tax=Candidatus Colimorpha enterica TaxID=3083063 RepID=R6TD87_9BACT|nr:type I restriction-modification system [Candidatus Colimorpha enterica]
MAVKKSEIYSSLWASCDALRGGMDASQYKDYILTLLFVKYVSDKFTGEDYADVEVPEGGSFDDMVKLIGKKNIGEGINKVIAKLAAANNLRGVIDKVSFNDPDKLGKEAFRAHAEKRLRYTADAFDIDTAAEIIGYSRGMVLSHIQQKHIDAVRISGKYIISKAAIVDFLVSDIAFGIVNKSAWHMNTILQFTKK